MRSVAEMKGMLKRVEDGQEHVASAEGFTDLESMRSVLLCTLGEFDDEPVVTALQSLQRIRDYCRKE